MVKRSRNSSVASSEAETNSLREEFESPRPAKLSTCETSPFQAAMQCSLPPHRDALEFATVEDFETHYAKDHANRCTSCGKNFPTAHFLALHIDEHHNTFREALQAKGEKTYACFVEDCDRKCSTPQKRRLHLIDKHLFPKVYNFQIVDVGIDKSTSMLREGRRRRVSTATDQAQPNSHQRRQTKTEHKTTSKHDPVPVALEEDNGRSVKGTQRETNASNLKSDISVSDAAINDLEVSMASLRFVPPSVAKKQRNKGRSGS
ncbi:hypothetical protein PV05_05356 [Exophiala xenobiotica]|uniref:C2H2-type domain-containing protein n=1 Tax=Exophiala xenobiotica TaxID=348802 RepID=A0A0D2EPQ9_9EURO|nr:uncharacterized protein PV05_05356 [Exophiala xenobiotica]KIW56720.1 hypothetical protein PV05_05356 [Exophiala xenobiotica]